MTTPAGKELFESSKTTIKEYSSIIDSNIREIEFCESLIKANKQIKHIKIPYLKKLNEILQETIQFLKLQCFYLDFSIDISISLRELMLATNKSEQIYYMKHIYIELYRFLEKLNNHLGLIKKFQAGETDYIEYNRSLHEFRAQFYDTIKTNRNHFFAHLNKHEYTEYYKLVTLLDAEEVAKMCSSFFQTQIKLSNLFTKIGRLQLSKTYEINEESNSHRTEINEIFEKIKTNVSEDDFNKLKTQLQKYYQPGD